MLEKKDAKKKALPTWSVVLIIILVGVLVSIGVIINNDLQNRITVRFFSEDEELIQQSRIRAGSDAIAPANPRESGKVFLGWSNPLIDVVDETNYHPLYRNIPQEENVFYIETGYAQHGKDYSVDIFLAGSEITVRTIQLGVAFDPNVLQYRSAESKTASLLESQICVEDNYVVLPLEIPEYFQAETIVVSLRFQVLDQGHIATDFPIDVYAAYKGTGPSAENADCITIKGTVYIY